MKVSELTRRLSKLDPNSDIFILSFSDAEDINNIVVTRDPDTDQSVSLIVTAERFGNSTSVTQVARRLANKVEDELDKNPVFLD